MKKREWLYGYMAIWLLTCLVILLFSSSVTPVGAYTCADLDGEHILKMNLEEAKEMEEKCRRDWDLIVAAKKPHEDSLKKMESQIEAFQKRLGQIDLELKKKGVEIKEGEDALGAKEEVLAARVRRFYIKSFHFNPFLMFVSQHKFADFVKTAGYQQAVTNEEKRIIVDIVLYIKDLEEKKDSLLQEETTLSNLKTEVNKRAESVKKLLAEATAYQKELEQKIADLSSRQQAILTERLAGLNLPTSLGAGALYCTDDRQRNPGFSPAFAFYTYGIPHRVGMNQYGAYGRAQTGQDYHAILQAYFNNISFEKRDSNMTIKVQGHGEMSLKEYTKRIYEMPDNWPMEALKAQAVAARSYVLAYTNNGQGEICTTQQCQVFKSDPKGGNWEQAVNATEGEVMISGGEVIKAWYSSTDGGYTHTSGEVWGSNKDWTKNLRDTTGEAGNFGDLQSQAYDKDSPCFYAAQGWREEYDKSAWLKTEEAADIVNALMLAKADSSITDHLYQTDKSHPYGGEVWDQSKVKQELKNRGLTPFNSISNISVSADFNAGKTTDISVSGDGGNRSFSGSEFKNYFNLRAPANIQIVGPLFNIEKK
ncbi:SpoIID/LytB domain-containing protein [Candidatus Microgenomates bacterium]|nr:SpoIID/LytB domain-containing protein [Candidatus Microgenomates bacterium]